MPSSEDSQSTHVPLSSFLISISATISLDAQARNLGFICESSLTRSIVTLSVVPLAQPPKYDELVHLFMFPTTLNSATIIQRPQKPLPPILTPHDVASPTSSPCNLTLQRKAKVAFLNTSNQVKSLSCSRLSHGFLPPLE